jgi:hypothetical protein
MFWDCCELLKVYYATLFINQTIIVVKQFVSRMSSENGPSSQFVQQGNDI